MGKKWADLASSTTGGSVAVRLPSDAGAGARTRTASGSVSDICAFVFPGPRAPDEPCRGGPRDWGRPSWSLGLLSRTPWAPRPRSPCSRTPPRGPSLRPRCPVGWGALSERDARSWRQSCIVHGNQETCIDIWLAGNQCKKLTTWNSSSFRTAYVIGRTENKTSDAKLIFAFAWIFCGFNEISRPATRFKSFQTQICLF